MNKTKTKRIHATLLLIISTIFLYTFNALAMVTEFTAGYGSNIILPEAPNNEPNDYPATPIEILESTLEMSLPEFGQKLYYLQNDIDLLSKDPLSFYSSPENININLNDYLSEAGTTVNTWIEAFNNTNSALPPELTTLNNKIQDVQERVKRIEAELGISIEEVAKTLDIQKKELEALALIPRNSDFYTEVENYVADMLKQNDEYKKVFSEADFSTEPFINIQKSVSEVQDEFGLHVSVHIFGMLVLPFEALIKSTEPNDLKKLFINSYIRNITEEIPQYNQDVTAVLKQYSTDPAIYKTPFMVKVINYLTEFHTNIDALCKSGLLKTAGETMELFQSVMLLDDKINSLRVQSELSPESAEELKKLNRDKADATLAFLAQLRILTEDNHSYIRNELNLKKEFVKQLTFMHNMPPDDSKYIRDDIQRLRAEITLLTEIDRLSSQMLTSVTQFVSNIISKVFLEDESYYDKTKQNISTTISRLETVKHYMTPDDAQIIDGEIARLQQKQNLLAEFYNTNQQQTEMVVNTSQLQIQSQNQPINTYITAASTSAEILGMKNSIRNAEKYLQQTQGVNPLPFGDPTALSKPKNYSTDAQQTVTLTTGDENIAPLSPQNEDYSTTIGLTKPESKALAKACNNFGMLLQNDSSEMSDLYSGLSNPDTVVDTILSAFSPSPINQSNHFTDEQTVILSMFGMISLGENYSNDPVLSSAIYKVTKKILANYNNTLRDILPEQFTTIVQYISHQNNNDFGRLSKETGISEDFITQIAELVKNHPKTTADFQLNIENVSAPIGYVAIDGKNGFINFTINNSIKPFSLEKFKNLSKENMVKLSKSTNISKEVLIQIQNNILHRSNGVFVMIIVDINGEQIPVLVLADTIVYINSTEPTKVAKEILKRILINRPNASEALVNKAFLLIVIIGLICIGFGVGLAVYITKLQLKKSNYFNPVLNRNKAYQHNFAPSWKTR